MQRPVSDTPEGIEGPTPESVRVVKSTDAPVATEVDREEVVVYDPYARRRWTATRLVEAIYLVFGLIEALIAIRFALKAFGANPNAGFAEFIYGVTAPFMAPFVSLFASPEVGVGIIELNGIVALLTYGLLGWLLAKLVWLLLGDTRWAIHRVERGVDTRVMR